MSLHDHPHAATGCCDDCEPAAPVRNHYFTGKLLVERDFTDEQHYFREKIRLHHQRLHGVGVVCGLNIKAHPNPACRDRMVVLEPGSAVDCCGHDILVADEEILSLDAFPAWQALKELDDDNQDHRLTFCLKYRECPTEEIPVLFDECGCDDSQCAPNRILESFEIDLRVDEPLPEKPYHSPKLEWNSTIGVAHAAFIALDEARSRAFVLTGDSAATLYQIDLTNNAVVASGAVGTKGLALAVSDDGKTVAVAARKTAAPGSKIVLKIFEPDTAGGIGTGPVRDGEVPDSAAGGALLAATTGGGFVMLGEGNGLLAIYPAAPDPLNPANRRVLGGVRTGLVLDGSGKAYVAQPGSGNIGEIDLNASALPETAKTVAGIKIDALVRVSDSAGLRLLASDGLAKQLHFVDPVVGTLLGSSAVLTGTPVQAIASPDGNWAWIVLDDATSASVAAVDIGRIRAGENPQAVGATPIERPVGPLALTAAGTRLYAPYIGDLAVAAEGGVAVIGVSETDCWAVLKGGDCPGCVVPDCLILATVENYQVGFKLEDMPAVPASDAANTIARIDNLTWRPLLPSTQAIAQALLCLKDRPGVKGDKGDPGQSIKGDPGESIKGDPGEDLRLDETLVHVCMISWPHRGEVKLTVLREQGLFIGFDQPIVREDVTKFPTLQVQFMHQDPETLGQCWCDVQLKNIEGMKCDPPCDPNGTMTISPDPMVNGLKLTFSTLPRGLTGRQWFRVLLHCDLIADNLDPAKARSVDGNHLAPWLPAKKSGDGIAGGTFESLFFVNFPAG